MLLLHEDGGNKSETEMRKDESERLNMYPGAKPNVLLAKPFTSSQWGWETGEYIKAIKNLTERQWQAIIKRSKELVHEVAPSKTSWRDRRDGSGSTGKPTRDKRSTLIEVDNAVLDGDGGDDSGTATSSENSRAATDTQALAATVTGSHRQPEAGVELEDTSST